MNRYLLIFSNEDCNPINILEEQEIKNIGQLKEDYGVEKFLDDWPEHQDPNSWNEGEALLLEARVLKIKPIKIVEGWEIEK